jgi:RND family efflux transporter MFP subunit
MASKILYSVVALVGITAASGLAYWAQRKPQGPTEITSAATGAGAGAAGAQRGGAGGPASVEVAKVEVSRLQDDAQSVGTLRSRQNVMLRPEVAGRIQTLGFSDGARVRKGDVLVQLDDVLQRAEVRQADAQVSIARANLKRNQELVAQGFIAQRVVDEATANVQVVEAQMALACARWERMRLVAPFDGTAGIRNVSLGDYVKDGADLVNIEDLSSMYVDFRLPERYQGKLRRDLQVELQLDAMPGRVFKAKIEAIDPQIDANGRSIAVRASLPNSGGEALAQRAGPAGAAGLGASGPSAGASAAAKPATAARPAARQAAKPNAQAAVDAAGGAPRAADAVAATCAANNALARGAGAGSAGPKAAQGTVKPGGSGNAAPAGGAKTAGGGAAGGGPLRPGMFARVNTVFNVKEKSLTVPEEAIVPQAGRQFVIKVIEQTEAQAKALAEAAKVAAAASAASAAAAGASGAASGSNAPAPAAPVFVDGKRLVSQRVEVKIGLRRAGRVELTEGVQEGDTVVLAGQQRLLRDNSPVRVVDLGRPAAGQGGGSGGQGGQGGQGPSGAPATAPSNAAPSNAASGAVAAAPAMPASR